MRKALLIAFFLCLGSARVVHMPENNCEFFSYGIQNGKDYIGICRADQARLQQLSWIIELTWHNTEKDLVGDIGLYPNDDEGFRDLDSGFRSNVLVRLGNITDELPQLTLLQLNGRTLCSNPKYSGNWISRRLMCNYSTPVTIPFLQNTHKETYPKLPVITGKPK